LLHCSVVADRVPPKQTMEAFEIESYVTQLLPYIASSSLVSIW
jgi:hypothetical protein